MVFNDFQLLKDMQEYYDLFFSVTSRHKNRQKNDMQPEFSYAHWLKEATKSENVKVDPEKYKYEIIKGGPLAYISYKNDMAKNKPALERQIKSTKTKVNMKFSIMRKGCLFGIATRISRIVSYWYLRRVAKETTWP